MHKNKFLRNNKIKDSPCVQEKKVAVKYKKRINKRLTINQKCLPKASVIPRISLDSIKPFRATGAKASGLSYRYLNTKPVLHQPDEALMPDPLQTSNSPFWLRH